MNFHIVGRRMPFFSTLRLWLLTSLLLAACQSAPDTTATVANTQAENSTQAEASGAEIAVESIDALPIDQAAPPVLLRMPALDFETAVKTMGWSVSGSGVRRATQWVVPADAAGWHVNSAPAGGAGNTILSGHQAVGDAVFAPLALGEIVVGQQILLTDEAGITFVYEVSEISEPIPAVAATAEDEAAAAAFITPSTDARLTLITGWPDFSTTHRIFAVAKFLGRATK